jgi:hypothetical protein
MLNEKLDAFAIELTELCKKYNLEMYTLGDSEDIELGLHGQEEIFTLDGGRKAQYSYGLIYDQENQMYKWFQFKSVYKPLGYRNGQ